METVRLRQIGHITTPYRSLDQCPRNIDPDGPVCRLVLNQSLRPGLMGLQVGQPILILYWLENVERDQLQQNSRRTGELAGVFDHEWAHGLDDNDAGGALSNSSEAYAAIAGIYRLQDSCVGHGFNAGRAAPAA